MRTTLVTLSTMILMSSLANASWANFLGKRDTVCTLDQVYKGLWRNPEIEHDASTYCLSSLLSSFATTSCAQTTTAYVTEFPSANTTVTVTSETSVPSSTVTVTVTAVIFDIPQSSSTAPTSTNPTARARHVRQVVEDVVKRQPLPTSRSSVDLTASLVSACTCNRALRRETSYTICGVNSTIYNSVIYETTTTQYRTITSGETTVTTIVNETTSIRTSSTSKTDTSTWTLSTTTTTSSPTVTPSGCPSNNGTRIEVQSDPCKYYERVCYRSYADSDFDDTQYQYRTPEECTAVCDAVNGPGNTACQGIVWNTTAVNGYNCRLLKSLKSPENETSSVALILQTRGNCPATSSNGTTSITSTTMPTSMFNSTTITSTTGNSSIIVSPTLTSNSSTPPEPTTTLMITNTTTSGCVPSTIYAAQYATVTLDQGGWNNTWSSWNKTASTVILTVTGNCSYTTITETTSVTIPSNVTVSETAFDTITVTNNSTNTITVTNNSTNTITVTNNSTSTTTETTSVSSCPPSPTESRWHWRMKNHR